MSLCSHTEHAEANQSNKDDNKSTMFTYVALVMDKLFLIVYYITVIVLLCYFVSQS